MIKLIAFWIRSHCSDYVVDFSECQNNLSSIFAQTQGTVLSNSGGFFCEMDYDVPIIIEFRVHEIDQWITKLKFLEED